MQFLPGGPDIPNDLLRAHEEGRVVFFCGAGISFPAGLPGFEELVVRIYRGLGTTPEGAECAAFRSRQYDATLELLEQRIPGGRSQLHDAVVKALEPDLTQEHATTTHEALLRLSRRRDRSLQLVTTNFDPLFHLAATRSNVTLPAYAAPLLPVPKQSRWNGVVFLHGLLPPGGPAGDMSDLVLTSGDFGRAYLTERWASRFVTDLFRNYSVCFVGYSLADPVMQYLMHALAAERRQGVVLPDAWTLAPYKSGEKPKSLRAWLANGVVPVLYDESDRHRALHATLKEWADTYADVDAARARIIRREACKTPPGNDEDDFVGRVVWALADTSRSTAETFARANPRPPFEWLDALLAAQKAGDLTWDHLAPLGPWLSSYVDDPRLALWFHQTPTAVPQGWRCAIEDAVQDLPGSAPNTSSAALTRGALVRRVLRLLLVQPAKPAGSVSSWINAVKQQGITPLARRELQACLTPRLVLRALVKAPPKRAPRDVRDIFHYEVELNERGARDLHQLFSEHPRIASGLVGEFQRALSDTLELLAALGEARDDRDPSGGDLACIEDNVRNRKYRDWIHVVFHLRDAWKALLQENSASALDSAQRWYLEPYPVFKRLALFAARKHPEIAAGEWLAWLLDEDGRWLWSDATRREVCRLLVERGRDLDAEQQSRLEQTLLSNEGEPDLWRDRSAWRLLTKLRQAGVKLGPDAHVRLARLSEQHPDLRVYDDQREEFSWSTLIEPADGEDESGSKVRAPETLDELVDWLPRSNDIYRSFFDTTWPVVCARTPDIALGALTRLENRGTWPANRWNEAFYVWSEDALLRQVWATAAPVVAEMPDDKLDDVRSGLSKMLEKAAPWVQEHERLFLGLCDRVLSLPGDSQDASFTARNRRPHDEAINDPIGQLVEGLIARWQKPLPTTAEGLPAELTPLFTKVCDARRPELRAGRVILGRNLLSLYDHDPAWTEQYLLPLFHPGIATGRSEQIDEARLCWLGFASSAEWDARILHAIREPLFESIDRTDDLGTDVAVVLAQYLTLGAFHRADGYTSSKVRRALGTLPKGGLEAAASTLFHQAAAAGEQGGDCWQRRVRRFWKLWPKDRDRKTEVIGRRLAMVAVAVGEVSFPNALEAFWYWIDLVDYPDPVVKELAKSELCTKCPEDALRLLDRVVQKQGWPVTALQACLDQMERAKRALAADPAFKRLRALRGA